MCGERGKWHSHGPGGKGGRIREATNKISYMPLALPVFLGLDRMEQSLSDKARAGGGGVNHYLRVISVYPQVPDVSVEP